ncbi:MAG: pyridoxamine 5'-phosphate oxidase [Candidatus Sericytochromatia bacterium]|nr:pyridoxamine 5'-phosphate oxidase [Candidatus Sericytochromatia bacterium]
MDNIEIENLRKDYLFAELNEDNINQDPIQQFDKWFNEALNSNLDEPNAMALATSTKDGKPSLRIVLLKGFSEQGFIFYTNYDSKKGHQIIENPHAAITFLWGELQRQVRIEGTVEKLSIEKSTEYFHSRPRGSQLGAISSHQSSVINSREELEDNYNKLDKKYQDKIIPKPENWGGFIVIPEKIEFWQGRTSRLHDRLLFEKDSNSWNLSRLSP